jgi:hypothetical protein
MAGSTRQTQAEARVVLADVGRWAAPGSARTYG